MLNNTMSVLCKTILIVLLFNIANCNWGKHEFRLNLGKDSDQTTPALFSGLNPGQAHIGFIVYDPEKKQVLQSHNRLSLFIPASSLKIATITAALEILGPDFRFKTYLSATGDIKNKVLYGDICLTGAGDPWLSITDFLPMIEKMQKSGIKKIQGKFYYDDSALVRTSQIDAGMEYDAIHNTSLSALSLDYNSIYAKWDYRWYSHNNPLRLALIPRIPFIKKAISPHNLKDNIKLELYQQNNTEHWLLSPELKHSGWQRLPVKQPSRFTAYMFKKLCELNGIEVPNPTRGKLTKGGSLLYTHSGKDLLTIAETTLSYSINIMTELMFLTAAKKLAGKPLNLVDSGQVIRDYYISRIRGIDWTGLKLVNGSGLSSHNRVSPEQMLGLLLYAESKRYANKSILTMMPVSGWKWTLQKRLVNPDAVLRVWAKTGSINYAMALAGALFTKSGKKLFFTLFVNDIEQRMLYEKNPDRRSAQNVTKAGNWGYSQRKLMDQLITNWINTY